LLATRFGVMAMETLLNGGSGVMVGLDGRDVHTVPLKEVTDKTREIGDNWFRLAHILSR
jgi:6-phosphofructokinase 1